MSDLELIKYIRRLGIWTPPVTIAVRFDISWIEARNRCRTLVDKGDLRERRGLYKSKAQA